jgi:hypothetical protein
VDSIGHGGDAVLVGFEQLQDGRQFTGKLFVDEAATAFVHQAAERVIAVQVNSSHNLHGGSPVGWVLSLSFTTHLRLLRPPAG